METVFKPDLDVAVLLKDFCIKNNINSTLLVPQLMI